MPGVRGKPNAICDRSRAHPVSCVQFDPARSESHENGFEFPYGDYQGIDLLGNQAVMVWGEGHNYVGGPPNPGHVIYRSMRT
jgi:hypothetical protein